MSPQSRMRMRPATSMHAQLRPISPSPPRKTRRTAPPRSAKAARICGTDEPIENLPGQTFELGRRRADREPALPGGQAKDAQHRLGRHRVGRHVARLEPVGLEKPGVDLTSGLDIALPEG